MEHQRIQVYFRDGYALALYLSLESDNRPNGHATQEKMRLSDFSVQGTRNHFIYRRSGGRLLKVDADGQWGGLTLKLVDGNRSQLRKRWMGRMMQVQRALNLKSCLEAKTGLDANTNLNDIKGTAAGFITKLMSANAKPELNYPIHCWCIVSAKNWC